MEQELFLINLAVSSVKTHCLRGIFGGVEKVYVTRVKRDDGGERGIWESFVNREGCISHG